LHRKKKKMPKITALVHTCNDGLYLGRALDSLRPCDEVVVVDHGSNDESLKIAREHGARTIKAVPGVARGAYAQNSTNDWIFCLLPVECVAEALEASLLEWKTTNPAQEAMGYNVRIREQEGTAWKFLSAEMRLVNRRQIRWTGDLPPQVPNAPALDGHILRIPDHS
jgi:glycosyltransferase involved in cell wall biosynthesis